MVKTPIHAIIMAGGKGTRMNATDVPKVLFKVCGKPMIRYVYDAIKGVADDIIIVTGFQGKKVEEEMAGESVRFVNQAEQLGTAHAVMQAEKLLKDKDGITLVTNGDHPLFTKETFSQLISEAQKNHHIITIGSAIEDDHPAYGRILRDEGGRVIGIREAKDATPEELEVKEKNPGIYAIKNEWLWPALKKIKKSPATGEYYITDLIAMAIADGAKVEAVPMSNPREIKGINTPEELEEVEEILGCR